MPRRKRESLPTSGDAFAVPLSDGRYSVCRVLADRETKPKLSIDAVLVACSAWIGSEIPTVDDPLLRPILHRSHHSYENEPLIVWVESAVPADFILLGKIPPTLDEIDLNCSLHGDWIHMRQQPLLQWDWDHHPEKVQQQDRDRRTARAKATAMRASHRRTHLAKATLSNLQRRRFFRKWTGKPDEIVKPARRIMRFTVAQLAELGLEASRKDRLQLLRQCIEAFNELERQHEFIDTVEREDICNEFELIVHAAGMGDQKNLADRWRDW